MLLETISQIRKYYLGKIDSSYANRRQQICMGFCLKFSLPAKQVSIPKKLEEGGVASQYNAVLVS